MESIQQMVIRGLIIPFTGIFNETNNGSHTIEFSVESGTGYGILKYDNSPGTESYYCYVELSGSHYLYELGAGECKESRVNLEFDENDDLKAFIINGIKYDSY